MKKKCHWRVVTRETDYYGGKTKAQARKLQKKLGKGRLEKFCQKPGGKSAGPASPLLQWTLIILAGTAIYMVVK